MTKFEKNLLNAQNEDKIIYYDYLSYKKAAGWTSGAVVDDWRRPMIVKKAKYNGNFLNSLPDYYFLGIPIKELLKSTYASGFSAACTVALSLCFDDFEIITCNLANYAEHTKNDYFESTFLVVDIDGVKTAIDPTFGFITDYDTYNEIFNLQEIKKISSDQVKDTKTYDHIKSLRDYVGPEISKDNVLVLQKGSWSPTLAHEMYEMVLDEHMYFCEGDAKIIRENKEDDKALTMDDVVLADFIGRSLLATSTKGCIISWRRKYNNKDVGNARFIYPATVLNSLEDDEKDNNLYSIYDSSIIDNERVQKYYSSALFTALRVVASRVSSLKSQKKKR
ncbi:MAG: hypothetical protein J1F35_05360 [Erysipelotrichales bacterium]|nr:hypothetical protein [Erysipelotrichales bacterium]